MSHIRHHMKERVTESTKILSFKYRVFYYLFRLFNLNFRGAYYTQEAYKDKNNIAVWAHTSPYEGEGNWKYRNPFFQR